jgi:predicted outer membrane repeat protein
MRRTLCALFLLLFHPAAAFAAPAIDITSPADDTQTKTTTITVVATVTGATGTLTVKVGSVPATADDPNNPDVFTASNVPLVHGPNTLTVTATDSDAPDSPTTADVHVTRLPFVVIDSPDDPNVAGLQFTTEHTFVDVTGHVQDDEPNGTISLSAGFFSFPVTLSGDLPNLTFTGRVNLNEGDSSIVATYTDEHGNSASSEVLKVTRTRVCTTKTDFPPPGTDPNDPNAPKNFFVDRSDDLPDADLDDPNCDVRPQFRPIPTDPNDPNQPFQPPLNVGHCTLRAAVQQANQHPGPDTITLNGVQKIVLTRTGGHEDLAARGDLDITGDTRIVGSSRDSIIIEAKKLGDRVFDVAPGVRLELVNLTIQGGRTPKPDKNDPNSVERGGCIRSQGRLEMVNVAVLSCSSDDAGGGLSLEDGNAVMACAVIARNKSKTDGGAIAADRSSITLRNSTLSINSASRRGGGISMIGDQDPLDLILTNDTLSQNKAKTGGGALDLGAQVKATFNNLTFANNAAKAGSSISTTDNATVEISNSILGDKSKSSCDPNSPEPAVSKGGNVELGDTCHLQTSLDDQPSTDPKLMPLATNNGTPTHRLKDTSPAIDHGGTKTDCEPLDQRDVERGDWPGNDPNLGLTAVPQFCDSGALELRTAPPQ